MKKLIVGLMVMLAAGCTVNKVNTEEFVNPLFYKRLEPRSRGSRETFLTPTSIKVSKDIVYTGAPNKNGWWFDDSCRLLENDQEHILMKCYIYNPLTDRMQLDYYNFEIAGCYKEYNGICKKWEIKLTEYDVKGYEGQGYLIIEETD